VKSLGANFERQVNQNICKLTIRLVEWWGNALKRHP